MVLTKLQDHQMLADVGIQLAKVPDSKNTYLYTEDREQYSSEAFKLCEASARKSLSLAKPATMLECGLSIYDTYTKFQKFNAKENYVAHVLLEVYKRHSSAVRMVIIGQSNLMSMKLEIYIVIYRNLMNLLNFSLFRAFFLKNPFSQMRSAFFNRLFGVLAQRPRRTA